MAMRADNCTLKYTHKYTHKYVYTQRGQEMQAISVVNSTNIVEAAGVTSSMLDKWIAYLDATPKTVETYTRAIRQFYFFLQANSIDRPTREDIIAYKEHLQADKKPTTVQAYIMACKQFFKWTAQEGIYPNIADNVKGAKLTAGFKKDYLTSKQAGKLLQSIDRQTLKGKRDYAILSLMMTTGLRTVEVSRANIEDLRTVADFTALFIQGKGRTERTEYVKIAEPVEVAIREYLTARGKAEDTEPLFASAAHRNGGERLTTRSISRIAKENMIDADLNSSRLTAHSLRHTAATLNLLNGGTVEETQQLLRHSNINTTLIYSHALERAKNNSEDRIAGALFG